MTTTTPHAAPTTRPGSAVPAALRYHRLTTVRPGWWRPLASLALALMAYAVLVALGLVSLVVAGLVDPRVERAMDTWTASPDLPDDDPFGLAILLLGLALMVPACRLAVRWTGRRGGLDSVTGRFRWRLFVQALAAPTLVIATCAVIGWLLEPRPLHPVAHAPVMAVVVLLLVPLQAAGEEYAFRGLLPQVVGGWLRSPVWGVLVSLPLFVAGHGYNALGLAGVAAYAAAASWAVWRTGGLEVVIAWHAVNNMVAFGLGVLGLVDPDAPVTTSSLLVDLALTLLVTAAIEWQWRRHWSTRFSATAARPVGPMAPPQEITPAA